MKKIDMHSHVGKFGGWAGFDSDIDTLIKFMDEYEVEKTVLCSADANTNEDTLAAFEKYPDRVFPVVFLNPYDGQKALDNLKYYVEEKGFKGIKMNPLKDAFVADDTIVDPILDAAEKYDIRDWAPEHEKMGKGITLSQEEAEALYELPGKTLKK